MIKLEYQFKIMKEIISVILMLHFTFTTAPYSPEDVSTVVSGICNGMKCISLLHISHFFNNGLNEDYFLKRMAKHLSRLGVQSSTLTRTANVKEIQNTCSKPFFVVTLRGHFIKMFLKDWFSNDSFTCSINWLFFAPEDMDIYEYFLDIIIPFNCEFLVAQFTRGSFILTEVYRTSPQSDTKICRYGSWTRESGLNVSRLYERRDSLHGLEVRAAAVEDPLYIRVNNISNSISLLDGYYAHLWPLLEQMLNFTTIWSVPWDKSFGAYINGTWNGAVEMVRTQQVDVGISDFVMNPQRYSVVDFSIPLFVDKSKFLIKLQNEVGMSWKVYILPFSSDFWIVLLIFLFLACSLLYFTHDVNNIYVDRNRRNFERLTLQESFFIILGTFCQKGYVVRQYSQAFRMVLFCSYLTAVIILASYSAALISSLTKPHPKIYNGIEELIDEGGYSLIVTKKTAMYQFLKDTSDETLHRLFKKYIRNQENSLPQTYSEALDRVCMDEKYVLFAYFGLVYSESSYPNCHLDDLPFNSVATPRGMIFPKTSWYKDVINYNLQKYMDYGVFDRLIAAATPRRLTVVRNPWTTVTLKMVSPVLIVLCFGCIASIVILLVEKVIAECNIAKYSKRSET